MSAIVKWFAKKYVISIINDVIEAAKSKAWISPGLALLSIGEAISALAYSSYLSNTMPSLRMIFAPQRNSPAR